MEIIAINDGSTDHSLAILREYEAANHCVRVIDQANGGVAAARNLGIETATGEYLMFVDDDDYLDPDYVTTYVNSFGSTDDVVIGGWRRRDGQGKLIYERRLVGSEWETYINVYAWSKMYRRDFVVRHEARFLSYGIGEDMFFWFSLLAHQPKLKIISYVGYTWSDNQISVSNTSHKGFDPKLDVLFLLERIAQQYSRRPPYLEYYFKRFLVWHMLYSGRDATPDEFIREYRRVWGWLAAREPSGLKPWSSCLRGERLFERASVFAFSAIARTHLMRLVAAAYCRHRRRL
jgi:glycosyltransferase involved in cell wall biosynthesis